MNRTRWARICGVLALVAASCAVPASTASAGPSTPTTARTAKAAKTASLTIKPNGILNGFTPRTLTIARGTKLVVHNRDSMRHTMTSNAKDKSGNPLFSTPLAPHSTTTVRGIGTLAAGTYRFYCSIHPNMKGTLIIKGGPGGTTAAGTSFRQPLVLPTQLSGRKVHIPVEYGRVRMLPTGPTTRMWTFGGSYPGPTVREPAGHRTTVIYTDKLPASTGSLTIHLHGDHHSSADDGQPAMTTGGQTNVLLRPGHSRTYRYALRNSADRTPRGAIDFYHDHSMGRTARNNWNGLQGMFIVTSPAEAKLHLPAGKYDVPLMVSDRSFTSNNRLAPFTVSGPPPNDTTIGTHILVNGRYLPYLDVATHRYRLQLLNSSLYQSYDFALSNGAKFRQIGTGSGLLPTSVLRRDIILGPAQRADVIVNFAGQLGKRVVLRSIPSTDHAPGAIGTPTAPIMQFRVTKRVSDPSKAPVHLVPIPKIHVPTTVAQTWDFGLDTSAPGGPSWTVNGQPYDPTTVMHTVDLGSTELWMLHNSTKVTHYIHLHEEEWHTIARIDANGVRHAPAPWERGLEDTWRIDPGASVEVAAKFTDYTGVFMIHCHMLDHEDDGMMAQFAVVSAAHPGLAPGYVYRPLSGAHRDLATAASASTGTGSMGVMGSMGGMGSMGRTSAPHRHRTRPAVATQLAAPLAPPAGPAWSNTLAQSGRSLGVDAALVLLVLLGVRLRRRRTR